MKVTIEVHEQTLRDILTTAVEQGISYWANSYNGGAGNKVVRDGNDYVTRLELGDVLDGAECDVPPVKRVVTLESLAKAVAEYGGVWVGKMLGEDYDARGADAMVQLAVFGDVVYG